MSYLAVKDFPPEETTDYILHNKDWVSEDNPQGTMYGFLQDGEWVVVLWGFNSCRYNTVVNVFIPTHYMPIPETKHLQ